MSQENVDVVRRYQSLMVGNAASDQEGSEGAFVEDRIAQSMALLDEDVVFRPFAGMPGHGGDWVGHDGIFRMYEAYTSAWEPPENVVFDFLDAGEDKVVLQISFDSKSKLSGEVVPVRMVEIITVRDGKITELVPYYHDGHLIVETAGGPKLAA